MARASRDPQLLRRLGSRLRTARLARGLTQQELADAVGVELRSIARFEAGTRGMSIFMLHQVSEAVGISAAELVMAEREGARSGSEDVAELAWGALWRRMSHEQRQLALRIVGEIAK